MECDVQTSSNINELWLWGTSVLRYGEREREREREREKEREIERERERER